MRTSFHHQPEAQHPKSSAIHKFGPADYPICYSNSDRVCCSAANNVKCQKQTSLARFEMKEAAN